ncbi:hypothetical protein [Trebonia sp.]|uniref:hypothetical protein n=1 Tax=Trebonia sp. TaxID=2767075 RepID=UPI0026023342|nr:hypothetical protein [Trebonia sp.]
MLAGRTTADTDRPDPANPATTFPSITTDGRVPREQAPRSPEPARFRLVHHAEVISLKGDSYRLKNRDLGRIPAASHDPGENS